jgi:transcriptional regulator of acetoin/glycerol metabolism
MGEDSILRASDLPESLFETQVPGNDGPRFYSELNLAKQKIIREALEAANWNYTQAAASLGINRTYLHRLARSLRVTPKGL